jgi:nucleoside-diphosphate-sugar epimerase
MINQTVLVTGGTCFVGVHSSLQLLQKRFKVHTTIRSLAKKEIVINALKEGGLSDLSNLSFYEADLTSDNGGLEAMQSVKYVLHVASPFPAQNPSDENELINPAGD